MRLRTLSSAIAVGRVDLLVGEARSGYGRFHIIILGKAGEALGSTLFTDTNDHGRAPRGFGDLNQDGQIDILGGSIKEQEVDIYFLNGTESLRKVMVKRDVKDEDGWPAMYLLSTDSIGNMHAETVGDLSGDGVLDMFIPVMQEQFSGVSTQVKMFACLMKTDGSVKMCHYMNTNGMKNVSPYRWPNGGMTFLGDIDRDGDVALAGVEEGVAVLTIAKVKVPGPAKKANTRACFSDAECISGTCIMVSLHSRLPLSLFLSLLSPSFSFSFCSTPCLSLPC